MENTIINPDKRLFVMRDIGVEQNGRWLVRNINLQVCAGEIVTIIGPNGAGKSTLAKALTGAITLSEGQLEKSDRLVVGYVPQRLSLDAAMPMSVDRLMQLTTRVTEQERIAALDACGIGHLQHAVITQLSGGELQRALLARAILRKPELLVLDEPVQGVDFAGEVALYDLIKKIRDTTGCGILMISHDLHIVMAETDNVLCLNGHVCCSGTPDKVAMNPEYLRLFGGPLSGGLAVYQHHHDHQHLPDGRVQHADGSITDDCHPDDGHHHHSMSDTINDMPARNIPAPAAQGRKQGRS